MVRRLLEQSRGGPATGLATLLCVACNPAPPGMDEASDTSDTSRDESTESTGGDVCESDIEINGVCFFPLELDLQVVGATARDFDSDGRSELVVQGTQRLTSLSFDAAGNLALETSTEVDFDADTQVLIAPFREPGQMDVFVARAGSGTLVGTSGNGLDEATTPQVFDYDSSFRFAQAGVLESPTDDVAWVVGTDDDGVGIAVYRLDNGAWEKDAIFESPVCPAHRVLTLDLDGDGRLDTVFEHSPDTCNPAPPGQSARIAVFQGTVAAFPEVPDVTEFGMARGTGPNGDDLILSVGGELSFYRWKRDSLAMTQQQTMANGVFVGAADVDGDNVPELFASPEDFGPTLLFSVSPYEQQASLPLPSEFSRLVAVSDLNGDGGEDLVFSLPEDRLYILFTS